MAKRFPLEHGRWTQAPCWASSLPHTFLGWYGRPLITSLSLCWRIGGFSLSLRGRGSRSEHRSAAQGNASLGIRSLCPGSARNRRASRHHAGNTPCRFALVFSAGTVERKIGSVDSMDPAVTASMNRALSALSHRRSFACVRAIRSRFVVWFPSWKPPFRPEDASSLLRQAFSGAESIVKLL